MGQLLRGVKATLIVGNGKLQARSWGFLPPPQAGARVLSQLVAQSSTAVTHKKTSSSRLAHLLCGVAIERRTASLHPTSGLRVTTSVGGTVGVGSKLHLMATPSFLLTP